MRKRELPLLFLKGTLMGICDLVPGISGGTIAFITGIYMRLIEAIQGFSPELVKDIFRYLFRTGKKDLKSLKEDIKKLDLVFLITLGAGISTAILIGSRAVAYLLDNHYIITISLFIGIISASALTIYQNIEEHHKWNILFLVYGLSVGIFLAAIIPANIEANLFYVFIGGFLAISAMFLPGISGAFILLILGLYRHMLEVLHDITGNIGDFTAFTLGAILGAFLISRAVSFLFRKDKNKTLYMLLGLVIGCLSIPVRDIIWNGNLIKIPALAHMYIAISFFFFILGFIVTWSMTHSAKRK